jgi:hypothetical protein
LSEANTTAGTLSVQTFAFEKTIFWKDFFIAAFATLVACVSQAQASFSRPIQTSALLCGNFEF